MTWRSRFDDPNRIAYVNNSLARTSLVLASLEPNPPLPADQLALLLSTFASPTNCSCSLPVPLSLPTNPAGHTARLESPLAQLRGSLHFITDHARDESFISSLLDLLLLPIGNDEDELMSTDENSSDLVTQFVGTLYGRQYVEQLRKRETVARFVAVSFLFAALP